LVARRADHHRARATGERDARGRAVRAGHRRGPPFVLEVGRQAAAKLADVPRAGDPHGDRPASELLIDVPDLVDPEPRREPRAVQAQVEVERAAERGLREGAVADAATRESSRTSPSSATNSGTHVLPSWATSGVALPTYAVSSFSCAAVQGICCTRTRMPGFSRSNAGISSATTSPSRPSPQKSSVTPPATGRQPARAAMKTAATSRLFTGTDP